MYLWIKALHVIAVISWMAGLLYLPRLLVYHSKVGLGAQSETFKLMERRLLRIIMTPAMLAAWMTGVFLAIDGNALLYGWLQAKLTLVLVMTGAHIHDAALVRAFAQDRNTHSERYFRIMNEIPTLLMIGIVILVVVKPF